MSGEVNLIDLTDLSMPKLISKAQTNAAVGAGHTLISLKNKPYLIFGGEDISLRELPEEDFTTGRLTVVDIRDVNQPNFVSSFQVQDSLLVNRKGFYSIHNAIIDDDKVFAAWYSAGLRAIDISDPLNPVEVGYYVPPGSRDPKGNLNTDYKLPSAPLIWGVYKHTDGYYYISDINRGMYVLEYTGP